MCQAATFFVCRKASESEGLNSINFVLDKPNRQGGSVFGVGHCVVRNSNDGTSYQDVQNSLS